MEMYWWRHIIGLVLVSTGWYQYICRAENVPISDGAAHLFYGTKPKVTALYGATARLDFKSNFSSQTMYNLVSFFIKVNGDTVAAGGATSISAETGTLFGNRIVTVSMRSDEYSLFLSNLRYEDNVVFIANVLVEEIPNPNFQYSIVRSNTTLEVIGGPDLCDGDLPSTTEVNTTENSHIQVVVCGNPKPTVAWGNGSVSLPGTSELVGGFKGRYKYDLALPRISPSMCGDEIKFVANGHSGVVKEGKTKLNVIFEPSTSIITSYRVNSSCIRVLWTSVDIGTCAGLTYHLEYLNATNFPLSTSNTSHPASDSIHCSGHVINVNFTRIRASFNGHVGGWSGGDDVLSSDPGDVGLPVNTEQSGRSSDDDEWKAIVGGVVGGFFFLLFLILIIYCCCCCGCCAAYCGCCVCSACCEKKKEEEKYGVESTNSLSFQYKKNSKKKTRSVKVDLKNKENNNSTSASNNTFAPVVIASDNEPAVIYAQTQKIEKIENQNSDDMKYFDPNEFDMEPEAPPVTLKSNYTNSTYDYGEDNDSENKPSFLI